jgi:hypothetical protein
MSFLEKINAITRDLPNSFYIGFNSDCWEHGRTVKEELESRESERSSSPIRPSDFISQQDYEKCILENKLWDIRHYPNTPVGFNNFRGSTPTIALNLLYNFMFNNIPETKPCELEQVILEITREKPNTFDLIFNNHWSYYETMVDVVKELKLTVADFVSEKDFQECISQNKMWVASYCTRSYQPGIESSYLAVHGINPLTATQELSKKLNELKI